jgi:hypothetical protein
MPERYADGQAVRMHVLRQTLHMRGHGQSVWRCVIHVELQLHERILAQPGEKNEIGVVRDKSLRTQERPQLLK